MARRKRNRLKQLEVVEVSLVSTPAIPAARFLIAKESKERLTVGHHATLDAIIAKHAPRTPAPDVTPQYELARVRAFMGGGR